MPIHLSILNPRQAEAGKIKIGRLGDERQSKSGGAYQLPEKQDFFTVTTTERGEDGNFIADVRLMDELDKDEDGQIRQIPILLSSDDIEEIFPTTLACYAGRNLHCRGDGKNKATRFDIQKQHRNGREVIVKTGNSSKVDCPCDYLGATTGLQCRPHGTLWCTIQAGPETQIGARHAFRTTSWESIRSILAGLQEIQRMVGTLVGPQLWLYVRPQKVKPKGTDTAKTIYVVHVRCKSRDIQELRERVLQQAQMRHNVAQIAGRPLRLGLQAPAEGESDSEQALIQQEYHPDEGLVYDPETGEVFETVIDDPSPEPQSQDTDDVDAQLPEDHHVRAKLTKLCKDAARARGFDGEDIRSGAHEIWIEACAVANLTGLQWKDLTLARARGIGREVQRIISEAQNRE